MTRQQFLAAIQNIIASQHSYSSKAISCFALQAQYDKNTD